MATLGGIKEAEGSANSLEVDNLARFAVDDHNKKENALLQFGKVVNVKQQVVAGTVRCRSSSPLLSKVMRSACGLHFQIRM
ncbi:hypothetical protein Vadar_011974 [Vaccinium darrowii]|uniref:Uncharacterized protein n=1 Tax=Vaccinium darrowii TaxID=229202 RepID=A0ACB7X9D1_9ERIC|nr:hypothetical protein Vadar_011974 [Vaccinium darrowii]